MINALRKKYRLNQLLQILKISKSSYCYQQATLLKPDKYADLCQSIADIFIENYEAYGYRRMHSVLRQYGYVVSEKVIRRLMKADGLNVKIHIMKKYSSYKGELTPEVPNLLERQFHADKPNQKWLTDITEFRIPSGKVYLSPIIDCYDGGVISWTIGTAPSAQLVNTMLEDAISTLRYDERPIIHSDHGCHYRWPGWICLMDQAGLTRSMSKKGCSPDNSACEGFFGRLKNEMFYDRTWIGVSLDSFMNQINRYVHWYNEKRIKASLGYMSPNEYRNKNGITPLSAALDGTSQKC